MTRDAGSSYASGVGGGGGNDWEVVSLTASTYAAAPGPVLPLLLDAHKKTESPPAASAIFMSQHFNLPATEAHASIVHRCQESAPATVPRDDEGATDNLNIPCLESRVRVLREQDGGSMTRCSDFHKDLSTTLGFNDGNLFADAGNAPPLLQGGGGAPVCLAGEERQATMLCSSAPPGFDATQPHAAGSDQIRSTSVHHHVSAAATDDIVDSASLPAHVVHAAAPSGPGVACVAPSKGPSTITPCEAQAWWNKTFRFVHNNSKESLTFRFDKLQLRLEFSVDSEKISCRVSEPLALGQVKVSTLGGSPIAHG